MADMSSETPRPAISFAKLFLSSRAWAVYEMRHGEKFGRYLGYVEPIAVESHIRRGRMQASPWFTARNSEDRRIEAGPEGHKVWRWRTRREAALALQEVVSA